METKKLIYSAIADFREKVSAVKKDTKNSFYNSKYADLPSILEAIKQPLQESKLSLHHKIIRYEDNTFALQSILAHTESGETEISEFPLFGTKAQEFGSSETYARRYNINALLDIPTEDDDWNIANTAPRTQSVQIGWNTVKYFWVKDLERCEAEWFAISKDAIKTWASDNGLTIWKPLQEVIIKYLETGEITQPVFTK